MTAFYRTQQRRWTIFLMHGREPTRKQGAISRQGMLFSATKGNSMINRFNGATKIAQSMARPPVTWSSVTKTARGIATTAQHTLTVLGVSAVAVAAVLYVRPDVAAKVSQLLAPAGSSMAVASTATQAPQLKSLMAA